MLVAFGANRSLQPTHLTAHIFIHCYFKNASEIRDVPFHQLGLLGSPLGCTICPSFLWVCHRHRCVITSCCWFASKAPPFRSGDGGRLGFSMPLVLRVKRLWGVYGADEHCTSPRGVLQSGRIWEIRSSASARNLFTQLRMALQKTVGLGGKGINLISQWQGMRDSAEVFPCLIALLCCCNVFNVAELQPVWIRELWRG